MLTDEGVTAIKAHRERLKAKRDAEQLAKRMQESVETSLASMRETVAAAPDWELEALERLAVGMMDIVGAEIAKRTREADER